MGMFKKFKSMTGSVDKDLLRNGLLGRGTLTEVQQTRVSTGGDDAFSRPVCVFTVEVALDNVARVHGLLLAVGADHGAAAVGARPDRDRSAGEPRQP